MKNPRIAYICADPGVPVFGRKGCSIHVQEVVRALHRRGAQVSLFAARFDGPQPLDLNDVTTDLLPCPREGDLATREQLCLQANQDLRRLLYATGPFDFVYERYSLWSYSGMSYARANHIPGLLEVNAPLIEEQAEHRGLVDGPAAEQVATRAFGDASALIAVSDEVANYLRARGARADAVRVIPNGVNPVRFPTDLTPTWGWPENESTFTVGFVGTLKPWHGVALLIEAFARLHQQQGSTRLLIVGDGPERARLQARVNELGLTEAAHFTGAVVADEIPGLLMAMDVAVAPYPKLDHFYFSPLKAYEYMAAGRAVVASRIGQLSHLIQHEQNGLLCEPGNVSDLTGQLMRLAADGALRNHLGAAGRKTILRAHTWDHVAERILELTRIPRSAGFPTSAVNGETPESVPTKTTVLLTQ
jgi:glycosyltransferase involved in cell wall biosynthesis